MENISILRTTIFVLDITPTTTLELICILLLRMGWWGANFWVLWLVGSQFWDIEFRAPFKNWSWSTLSCHCLFLLEMNTTKTELFTAGLDHSESLAIASYRFSTGSFPIRYLGLPLMSRTRSWPKSPEAFKHGLSAAFFRWPAPAPEICHFWAD